MRSNGLMAVRLSASEKLTPDLGSDLWLSVTSATCICMCVSAIICQLLYADLIIRNTCPAHSYNAYRHGHTHAYTHSYRLFHTHTHTHTHIGEKRKKEN